MTEILKKNPFLLICICAFTGIIGAKFFIPMFHSLFITFLSLCFSILFKLKKRTRVSNMFLLLAIAGATAIRFNLSTSFQSRNHLNNYDEACIGFIEGVIDDSFIKKDGQNRYLLKIYSIALPAEMMNVSGRVIVQTKNMNLQLSYGDSVRLYGQLKMPDQKRFPGQFDYRQYLAEQDIYHILKIGPSDSLVLIGCGGGNYLVRTIVVPLRKYFRHTFETYLPDQPAALLKALILGEKQDLGNSMITTFRQVGVVHVLAISGLHVGFIIAFVFGLTSLFRLNQDQKFAVLLLTLLIYIILVRFKTPVIRASSMAMLFLAAKRIERQSSIYNVIFASLFLILMIDPRELFKPGFQFSFLAVLSIIYGYEKLNDLIPLHKSLKKCRFPWINSFLSKWIWIPFLVSMAAVLGTLPLTLYYYGAIPLYAIFANLLIIPITGLIVFLCLFLLIMALFSSFLSAGIGIMVSVIFLILQEVTEWFAGIPYVSIITIRPTFYQILLLYLLIYILLNFKSYTGFKFIMLLLLPVALFFLNIFIKADRDLKVTFLDVGQGDAAFIEFPNGKTMLIDGGSVSRYWNYGEKTILPFLQASGIINLNYLVGSHAHNDHIGGFPYLMERITVDTLVLSAYQYHSHLFKEIKHLLPTHHISLKTVSKGDQLFPDPTCRVYILHPDSQYSQASSYSGMECNNSSVVMKIKYGENSVLFSGDLEGEGEIPVLLYQSFLESEIIKVGHHGSITSTSDQFLEKINPIAAVVSVAEKNKFGHPSSLTINRLHARGTRTYLTSQEGTIQFLIEPDRIKRISWR